MFIKELSICSILLILSACLVLSLSDEEWDSYKRQYGKSYPNMKVELLKREIVSKQKKIIDEFNEGATFKLGLNAKSDEFNLYNHNYVNKMAAPKSWLDEQKSPEESMEAQEFLYNLLNSIDDSKVPEQIDWRTVPNRVTPVRDQAGCPSGYAFAAIGALEGQMVARNKTLVPLSEQNMIDCSMRNRGCMSGTPDEVFWFIKRQKGIQDAASYPYKAKRGQCSFDSNHTAFYCSGATMLTSQDEKELKKVVGTFGPVTAIVNTQDLFFLYDSGIFYDKKCISNIYEFSHTVLVVGYGTTEDKQDYWIIKNSWGTSWGEDGYMRIARNKNNHCGIATRPVIPFFKN